MTSTVKLTGLAVASACPESPAAGRPGFSASSLGEARLCGIRLSGLRRAASGMSGLGVRDIAMCGISERPTQAPAVAVAQAHAYATANGAQAPIAWTNGAGFAAPVAGAAVASKTQQTKKRAFRGLEPWRDPA